MSEFIHYEVVNLNGYAVCNFWAPLFHIALKQGRDCRLCSELKPTLRDLRCLEGNIRRREDLMGWITWVKHDYPQVKRIVQRLGGCPFLVLGDRTWYFKQLSKEA